MGANQPSAGINRSGPGLREQAGKPSSVLIKDSCQTCLGAWGVVGVGRPNEQDFTEDVCSLNWSKHGPSCKQYLVIVCKIILCKNAPLQFLLSFFHVQALCCPPVVPGESESQMMLLKDLFLADFPIRNLSLQKTLAFNTHKSVDVYNIIPCNGMAFYLCDPILNKWRY